MNLPPHWPGMTAYAKRCYLVNTHLAKSFSDAGRILSQLRRRSPAPAQSTNQPQQRLPYKDNE